MNAGNELDALLSAHIDGERLTHDEQQRLTSALESSRAYQRDLRLQQATRNLVRTRATALTVEPPQRLKDAIAASLDAQQRRAPSVGSAPTPTLGERLRSLFAAPRYVQGLIAVGSVVVIALTALVLLRGPLGTSGTSHELSSSAYAAFTSVMNGSFTIDKVSSDPSELSSYFARKGVTFPVFYPEVHAELRGGSVVTINGEQCAQLVYATGPSTIYLLEADNADVVDGTVSLDKQIRDDVELSRWHWEERADVGTMFVWKSNNIMCTAVSNLPTHEFSALFRLETL